MEQVCVHLEELHEKILNLDDSDIQKASNILKNFKIAFDHACLSKNVTINKKTTFLHGFKTAIKETNNDVSRAPIYDLFTDYAS